MSNNQKKILKYIKEHPLATIRELQQNLGISSSSVVHHHLVRLREMGMIANSVPLKSLQELRKEKFFYWKP